MYIQKIPKSNTYEAIGLGLRATGKSHLQALTNLFREIKSMQELYSSYGLTY
jgi:hypothetical protein